MAKGARITIVRHGVPVAVLVPADDGRTRPLADVIADVRAFGKGRRLRGISVRRRQLRHADATRFLALVSELPIEVDRAPTLREARELLALGREQRLSAYDAAYLYLATRERLPLATRDAAFRAAMRATGVTAFAP